jgi:hypothetical protein
MEASHAPEPKTHVHHPARGAVVANLKNKIGQSAIPAVALGKNGIALRGVWVHPGFKGQLTECEIRGARDLRVLARRGVQIYGVIRTGGLCLNGQPNSQRQRGH